MTIASRLIRILSIAVTLTLIVSAISTQVFVQKNEATLFQLRDIGEGVAQQTLCRDISIPFLSRMLSPLLGMLLLLLIATVGTIFYMRNKEKRSLIDKDGVGIYLATIMAIVFITIQIWEPEYSLLTCLI